MKLLAFSVYDEKVQAFNAPFFSPANGHAIRSFGDLVNDEKSSLSRHPGDYMLYRVGEFNDATGELRCDGLPVRLAAGTEFREES